MDELLLTLPLNLTEAQTRRVVTTLDHFTFTDPAFADLEPGIAFDSTVVEPKIDAPGIDTADVNRLYDALVKAIAEGD